MVEATGVTSLRLRIINLREGLGRWYKSLGQRALGTSTYSHRIVRCLCHFLEMAKFLAPADTCYVGGEIIAS